METSARWWADPHWCLALIFFVVWYLFLVLVLLVLVNCCDGDITSLVFSFDIFCFLLFGCLVFVLGVGVAGVS